MIANNVRSLESDDPGVLDSAGAAGPSAGPRGQRRNDYISASFSRAARRVTGVGWSSDDHGVVGRVVRRGVLLDADEDRR
ncbi:MAG: hypothetical protein K8M05_21410, partial [Deltaproteobacteria bacterium]|nr:hypothetical protein [Kofleriaceae bacterium]